MPQIPFTGSDYKLDPRAVSFQSCVNMYLEEVEVPNAKQKYINRGCSGTDLFMDIDVDDTICRGIFKSATGVFFVVFGSKLYKVTDSTNYELVSSGISGSTISRVSMAESLFYMIIVDGVNMYSYEYATGTFAQVTSYPAGATPKKVAFVSGRMVAINSGDTDAKRNTVYYSEAGPDKVMNWSDIQSFSAEQSADAIVSMEVSNGYLWLLGDESYEIHQPTNSEADPFDLIQSTTNSIGCKAPLGTTVIADRIFWIGSSTAGNGQMFMSNGLGYQRISNHAIEHELTNALNQGISIEDTVVFSYQEAGHTFVVFTFTSLNKTYEYDITTGLFATRETYNPDTYEGDRWRPQFAIEFNGQILLGGVNGQVLFLNSEKYSDYDDTQENNILPMVAERMSPVYWDNLLDVTCQEFVIDLEAGVGYGQPTDQSFDPVVMISVSRDGGYTWDNERQVKIGKIGKYGKRCFVRGLGHGRNIIVRYRVSDPVPRTIIGATGVFQASRGR